MTAAPQDLKDADVLEHAAWVLLRRFPGTRPDGLEETIANLQWIVRAIRRLPAPARPPLCRAHPDDCPNGPEPHAYYNPPEYEGRMCCCRQPGEEMQPR